MTELKFYNRTQTTNILLLPTSRNLLTRPRASSETTDSFFLGFSSKYKHTRLCFFKFFNAATESITKFLTQILILITLSVYEGKHLQISQKIHTHNISITYKMWLEFFLLYLKQNIKPYTSYGLGLSWKFCRKNNLHEVQSIESNFRSIEPCRFSPINFSITQFQLYT